MKFLSISALAVTFLFGCASSNKVATHSFGGGWVDGSGNVSAKPAESIPAQADAPILVEETQVSVQSTVVESTSAQKTVTSTAIGEHSAAAPVSVQKPLENKRQAVKQLISLKKQLKNTKEVDNKLLLVLIALFLPWLSVLLYEGSVGSNFWITLLLWLLFILPGFIYALLVIFDVI